MRRCATSLLIPPLLATACREAGGTRHPLDPLDAREMRTAQSVLRDAGLLDAARRLVLLDLNEPRKSDVLRGVRTPREAYAVLYDSRRNATGEAVVDVDARALRHWHEVPGVQPALDGVDGALAESLTRASPEWRAALARRGTTPDAVVVFTWSAGAFGEEDPARGRLVRTLTYMRAAGDNEMARPVEGLVALVDLTARRVIRVDDTPNVPVPDATSERDAWRPLPPPITPDGPTAPWSSAAWAGAAPRVDAHAVSWRRWRFRVAVRPREGLMLYAVGFDDGSRVRSVMYRGSLSEMVVPYGDPSAGWYFRNAFDVGELGMGTVVTSLDPGVDCPRDAALLDATVADAAGSPRLVRRAVAFYVRDGGLAWKHAGEGRRARELVVLSVSRLGNYDYGFEWVFKESGALAHRVLLTGVMASKGVTPGQRDSLSHVVATGVAAPQHQHFFSYRLDVDVDAAAPNQVEEIGTGPLAAGGGNPHGGGFATTAHLIASEDSGRRHLDLHSSRRWRVVNPEVRGSLGTPSGYELLPGANADPFVAESSAVRRRAGFLGAHLWVTAYADSERYAAGNYPNQSSGGDGLPRWTSANRRLTNADVVLWYTLGVTHTPRPEDWPVMPVHEVGFELVPVGFFDRNPVLVRR
ncbi:MAG: primary-amine oxidase [Gemmatimonadaceae bacterium]